MGADYHDFGHKLQAERERQKLTLEQVANETRIKESYLASLERGEWPANVGDVYAKNFLRNYAKFLGLDPVELMPAAKKRATVAPTTKRKKPKIRQDIVTTKLLFLGTLTLIMVGIIAYLIWQILILSSAPPLKISSPEVDVVVSSPEYVIEGKTSLGSEIHINDVAILLGPDGTFMHRVALRQGVNNFVVTSTNRLGKTRTVERAIVFDSTLEEPR